MSNLSLSTRDGAVKYNTVVKNSFNDIKPEILDWGVRYLAACEMDALRLGYKHRHSPHGYRIEYCPNILKWAVTVWNERAKELGCDL